MQAKTYLQPLAHYVKHELPNLTSYYSLGINSHPQGVRKRPLVVWSSPDAVGNWTRYSRPAMIGPRLYADLWEQMFLNAPDFDHTAQQDAIGGGSNSIATAAFFLGNLSAAATRQGRTQWANVELFRTWPPSCQWSEGHPCTGRAPASMTRILQQISSAAHVLSRGNLSMAGQSVLIAWEWTSCLSPYGGDAHDRGGNISNITRANWLAYKEYLSMNVSVAKNK